MGLTISLNRVSFLPPPVRSNIFYEIETSSIGLYNTGLSEKPLKTMDNFGLDPPIFPLFSECLDPPPVYFEKKL